MSMAKEGSVCDDVSIIENGTMSSETLILSLREEINELRRQLHMHQSMGCGMGSCPGDGPAASIVYFNTKQSRKKRRELESCCQGNQDMWCTGDGGSGSTQSSSVDIKIINGALLKAVGLVEYYSNFCVDRLGNPVALRGDELVADYEPPKYEQVYLATLWTGPATKTTNKGFVSKSKCFNCGHGDHMLRDCPLPRNFSAITKNRQQYDSSNPNPMGKSRYHVDEKNNARFAHFVPGQISNKLCMALAVPSGSIPPYIEKMRSLGYPPGYQNHRDDKHMGLILYDDAREKADRNSKPDVEIQYPGFNCSHITPQNDNAGKCNKRRRSSHGNGKRKVSRISASSDMEIESSSDLELEDGEIYSVLSSVTTSPQRRRSSAGSSNGNNNMAATSSTDKRDVTKLKKRFSMDFPPSVLPSPGEEVATTPTRWNSIKDILDKA